MADIWGNFPPLRVSKSTELLILIIIECLLKLWETFKHLNQKTADRTKPGTNLTCVRPAIHRVRNLVHNKRRGHSGKAHTENHASAPPPPPPPPRHRHRHRHHNLPWRKRPATALICGTLTTTAYMATSTSCSFAHFCTCQIVSDCTCDVLVSFLSYRTKMSDFVSYAELAWVRLSAPNSSDTCPKFQISSSGLSECPLSWRICTVLNRQQEVAHIEVIPFLISN